MRALRFLSAIAFGLGIAACGAHESAPPTMASLRHDGPSSDDGELVGRWALTLLTQALARLRQEFGDDGKIREFDHLKVFLSTPTIDRAYDELAVKLEVTVDTVAVKVHRLRQRYGELIREEIAHTVGGPAEIEDELQHLFKAVGR